MAGDAHEAEADRLIDEGQGLGVIYPLFGSRTDAAVHYGKRLAERYSLERVGNVCALCGGTGDVRATALEWRVVTWSIAGGGAALLAAVQTVLLVSAQRWVSFTTVHALCASCREAVEERVPFRRGLLLVGAAGILAGLVMLGVAGSQFATANLRGEDRAWFQWVLAGGAGAVVVGIVCLVAGSRVRVPERLKEIAPPPVELYSAGAVRE